VARLSELTRGGTIEVVCCEPRSESEMECDYCHREFDPIATRWLCPHCHMKANCCDGAPLPQVEVLRRVTDLLKADSPTAR
jgi:hypothetical protein